MKNRAIIFGYIDETVQLARIVNRHSVLAGMVVPSNRLDRISPPLQNLSLEEELPFYIQPSMNSRAYESFIKELRSLDAALFITFSYPMILNNEILASARLGAVNIHNGKLPKYRGCNTINWAVANGEHEAGVSLHWLDNGIDTGNLIATATEKINFTDTVLDLREKLIHRSLIMVDQILSAILDGTAPVLPQDEAHSNYYRQRKPEDGQIDWTRPALEIYNLIRASVSPWPGAYYINPAGDKIIIDHFMTFDEVADMKERFDTAGAEPDRSVRWPVSPGVS